MKVLFVSSGNSKFGINPIIKNQGESLIENGIEIQYFTINGRGLIGYLRNFLPLIRVLRLNNISLVHSHFFLSSILASITKRTKLIVSLMGSDVHQGFIWSTGIRIFNRLFWDQLIVKSSSMNEKVRINNAKIIPNGVNIRIFTPIDKINARQKLNLQMKKKYILFAADPKRPEKNFKLVKQAIENMHSSEVELIVVYNKPIEQIVLYLNAVDVLILSSLYEGSPNIVKEAMACNCPIVSTNVGDVKEIIKGTKGCFITTNKVDDMIYCLNLAIQFSDINSKTDGRNKIIEMGLDSDSVAKSIIKLYQILKS